jgi:hypothetical protein
MVAATAPYPVDIDLAGTEAVPDRHLAVMLISVPLSQAFGTVVGMLKQALIGVSRRSL